MMEATKMKRYRVFSMDFDSGAMMLTQEIRDDWEPTVKELHHQNRRQIQESLIHAFGASNYKGKRQNYIDLGTKPFSVMGQLAQPLFWFFSHH